MVAFEGKVKGNTIVIDDGDISAYNGNTVIVTVLDRTFSDTEEKRSRPAFQRKRNSVQAYQSDNGQNAQGAADDDNSYHKLLRLKKEFHFGNDFDPEREIEEALQEKYGSID